MIDPEKITKPLADVINTAALFLFLAYLITVMAGAALLFAGSPGEPTLLDAIRNAISEDPEQPNAQTHAPASNHD